MTATVPPLSVTVALPADWSYTTAAGPLVLVARADEPAGSFAPNLTLALSRVEPGLPIDAYLAQQLAGVTGGLADAIVLEVSLDRAVPALTILAAHTTTGVDLTMIQHHRFERDGWVVAACATASNGDWPVLEAGLRELVRSARCIG